MTKSNWTYTATVSAFGPRANFDNLRDAKAWAKERNGNVWRNLDGKLVASFANYY